MYPDAMCARRFVSAIRGAGARRRPRARCVPRCWLSDGVVQRWCRFEGRDVQGLTPRTRLLYINVWDDEPKVGATRMVLRQVSVKFLRSEQRRVVSIISWSFYSTIELAIYTKLLLTLGGSNHGGKRNLNYFGDNGGRCVMSRGK